jgi:serine/threonine protein phosphatase PrpC
MKLVKDMAIRPGVELASLSDIGCQREQNEDCFGYWESASDQQFEGKGRLAIVADGMGGYEGGQEASRIAVDTVRETYETAPGSDPQAALLEALQRAHERIRDFANHNPELMGMGTTCTAAALTQGKLYFAHVGDCRLYLLRGSQIQQLTRDHSYVKRLVDSGYLKPADAESHPQRHILTAALGVGEELTPDVPSDPLVLQEGDVLLLCTDGLWGVVRDEELRDIIASHSPEASCHEFVELAKKRGGPDNITVQILRVAQNGRA